MLRLGPLGSAAVAVLCSWLARGSAGLEVPDKIYWTSFQAAGIYRANLLDGSGVEEVLSVPASYPWGLAIDAGRCWMYFTHFGTHAIKRAHLDGSGASVFIQLSDADAVALWRSEEENMLYWTQTDARVKRTSLTGDGSVIEELLTFNSGYYYDRWGVAADTGVTPVKLYFGDNDDFFISKQAWGTEEEDGLFVKDPKAIWQPQAMDIDPVTRRLYWADDGFADIRHVSLDGDGHSDVAVLASGLTKPRGLTLDTIGRKAYFTDIGPSAGSHRIHQVDLDGNAGWTIQLEGVPKPSAVAIMNSTLTDAAVCFTTTTTSSTTTMLI